MRGATIIAAAKWLPETIRYNEDWSEEAVKKFKQRIFNKDEKILIDLDVGVASGYMSEFLKKELGDPFLGSKRRRVAKDIEPQEVDYLAAEKVFEQTGIEKSKVKYVMSYSMTPEYGMQTHGTVSNAIKDIATVLNKTNLK